MGITNSTCYRSKNVVTNDKANKILSLYIKNFDELNESFNCMICLMKPINYTPSCGHMGICEECNEILKNTNHSRKCMICKKNIRYNKVILPFTKNMIDRNSFKINQAPENLEIKNKFNNISVNIIEDFKYEATKLSSQINVLDKNYYNNLSKLKNVRSEYNELRTKKDFLENNILKLNNQQKKLLDKIENLKNNLINIEIEIEESISYHEELKKCNEEYSQMNQNLERENIKLKTDNEKYIINNYIFKEDANIIRVNSDVIVSNIEDNLNSNDKITCSS